MVPTKCKCADSKSSASLPKKDPGYEDASLRGTLLKTKKYQTLPDRNIGVPLVHKYAIYRTLNHNCFSTAYRL